MELELVTALTNLRDTALTIAVLLPAVGVALFALKAWMETDSAGPRRRRTDRAW
jgi:type III secretory pathway component EscS